MQPTEENEFREAIKGTHGCEARFIESVPVREVFRGDVAWQGIVDVFALSGHPRAKRCYAWRIRHGSEWRYTLVLDIPPVDSAETAVKMAIAAEARKV